MVENSVIKNRVAAIFGGIFSNDHIYYRIAIDFYCLELGLQITNYYVL